MEQTSVNAVYGSQGVARNQPSAATADPLHQYALPQANQGSPAMAPAPYYPSYQQQVAPVYPVKTTAAVSVLTSQALTAGLFGLLLVGSTSLGTNLRKVSEGEMGMGEAAGNSLFKGAAGGLAFAAATAAANSLTEGGTSGLLVTLATATGVSYLLNQGT